MSIAFTIPQSIVQAIRLPEEQVGPELRKELAVVLYQRGYLALGKARELAGMEKYEFGQLLGARAIPRHYEAEELADDLTYADHQ